MDGEINGRNQRPSRSPKTDLNPVYFTLSAQSDCFAFGVFFCHCHQEFKQVLGIGKRSPPLPFCDCDPLFDVTLSIGMNEWQTLFPHPTKNELSA